MSLKYILVLRRFFSGVHPNTRCSYTGEKRIKFWTIGIVKQDENNFQKASTRVEKKIHFSENAGT